MTQLLLALVVLQGTATHTSRLLLPPADSGPAGSTVGVAVVTVRVYEHSVYTSGLVAALQPAVSQLLEGSGVDVTLVDCRDRVECQTPIGDDLVLRMVPGRMRTHQAVCGEASMGVDAQPGALITVYRGCVAGVASKVRRNAGHDERRALLKLTEVDVLAPIVVHEMLHLLIPGEVHGSGICKAVLDKGDLERAARGVLRLDAETTRRLRAALAVRNRARAGGDL